MGASENPLPGLDLGDDRGLDRPGSASLLLLAVLFVGSGCSALIYEIVWLQSLQLVIGSSATSLGVLLGTFMGGMCLGSLLFPRLVSPRRHPLRVYALIELGIGVCGLILLVGLPHIHQLYATHIGHGLGSVVVRAGVCALCLLAPTMLMGATLPAIARRVQATPRGIAWLGFFYGSNIAGAVLGCLLAGFYLLRVHDMVVATCVAGALNLGVASIALLLTRCTAHHPPAGCPEATRPLASQAPRPRRAAACVVIGLSGLCALGAEVVWTHILSLLLGGTVYTFSLILAAFLVGLGIGSSVGSAIARDSGRPRLALGVCQLLLTLAVAWAAYALGESVPYWPVDPSLAKSPWLSFQIDLVRCFWVVLPGAILWGASFPLALAWAGSRTADPGRIVAGIYAANTVGAIVGSLAFSMVLIPCLGTQNSERVMIALAALAAALALIPWEKLTRSEDEKVRTESAPALRPSHLRTFLPSLFVAATAAVSALATLLIWQTPPIPPELVAYGRHLPTRTGTAEVLYVGEGRNSAVAVTRLDGNVTSFHVCGKVEASTEPADMRLQRMLGHLSALLHPKPRKVLVVGCGAGVTAGCFVLHPEVERIVLCEIEPLIPKVASRYFAKENYDVVNDPRVEIVYDDARHYILTTQQKFDVITSDPIHPWMKGSAALYTREYFDLCKRHLNPGGLVTQWVPLYESDEDVVQSEIATFFTAFPEGTIWSNDINGEGYDVVLLGRIEPLRIDVPALQDRLDREDHARVVESLREVEFHTALDLLATYAGQGPDLAPWLADAQINTDRNLRLQYLAGLGLNVSEGQRIYDDLIARRKFPERLFIAPPIEKLELRDAIGN
ncbi:MAG: fused MFS/spermidine synthase [Phycisphaerae bacterium]|nr:fused MFS/spermidine synthase [Phycisphaerae bacterium]